MIEILKNNNKIIINTDLDGIISGLILQDQLGCNIVGFSNSADKVWFDDQKIKTIHDAVYIDMYIANPKCKCIDQHIVAANQNHLSVITQNRNKINPNLLNHRCHVPYEIYYKKYPFGTVHFIIALLDSTGRNFDIVKGVEDINIYDLILRADDTLKTTLNSPYKDNAKEWWKWLITLSKNGRNIRGLIEYLGKQSRDEISILNKKKEIEEELKKEYKCDTPDGGMHNVLDKEQLTKKELQEYIDYIAKLLKVDSIKLASTYNFKKGKVKRIKLTEQQTQELITTNKIDGEYLFSYAFVNTKNNSFSYTIM